MNEGELQKRIKEILTEDYDDWGKPYFFVDDKDDVLKIVEEAKKEFRKLDKDLVKKLQWQCLHMGNVDPLFVRTRRLIEKWFGSGKGERR